jgi:cytochrome c-type biogenesis protein CcmH/NrfG
MAEDCTANFRGDPSNVHVQAAASQALTTAGESALSYADKITDPADKVEVIKAGVDRLRDALIKDPYNAEATLLLALAYDTVHKKGCAIALLRRLASLTANSKYTSAANRQISAVDHTSRWFRYYRKDAMVAIGH